MTEASEWRGRVGDVWAEEWRRTDRALGPLEEALVATAAPALAATANPAILDLGCGAGSTSIAFADAVAGATVTGIDLSEALVAVARARSAGRPELAFEVADAGRWSPIGGGRFDAIVSRHGVMFFDDPVAAFAHIRTLAAPAASLTFSCVRAREENEWAQALAPILARFASAVESAPPPAIGPFAFAEPARIERILAAAGFAAPRIDPFDFAFVAGAGADPVAEALAYFRRIGPFAAMLSELEGSRQAEALGHLADIVRAHLDGGRAVFRAAAWIVSTNAGEQQ